VLGLALLCNGVGALGPAAVNLNTAGNFTILAKSGVSTVPQSNIIGNVGVSPIGAGALTGFSLTLDPSGTFSTSTQVTGQLFAADYTSPTPPQLTTAILDMQAAFSDASGRSNPDYLNLNGGELGGLTLEPGLYKWTTGLTMSSGLTISGNATDTWIFQTDGTFTIAAGQLMTLAGGALASQIVWAVSGAISYGAGAHIEGVILGATSATFQTGSSINGRILVQTAVTLQSATVVS
jgi:hypothetical protein